MPRGDRTGSQGLGPMTGRRAGFCAGYNAPGFTNPAPRLGLRRGYGGGHGWRHQYYATGSTAWQRDSYVQPMPEQELIQLKNEAEWLKNRLEVVNQRMEELEPKQQ